MTNPTVSIILPTHNRAGLLWRSVSSVLAQTYRDFELIVVDDASSDHTQQMLRQFDDPRLRVILRKENGRAAAARNDGMRAARGSMLAFQDDDDIWLPHKLELQVAEMLKQPDDVGVVLAGYFRSMRYSVEYVGGTRFFERLDFAQGNPGGIDYGLIATPGWLLRRSWAERAGEFDVRLCSWDDWELGLRLWKICRFAHVDEPLFIQDLVRGSQMMQNDAGRVRDLRVIREKHADLWADRPQVRAAHHFFIGRRECAYGDMAAGRRELRDCLKARPFHARAAVAYLVSLLGSGGVLWVMALLQAIRYPATIDNLFRKPVPPAAGTQARVEGE
jgi:glycosyltransferase involved in cell wall biosynthesis